MRNKGGKWNFHGKKKQWITLMTFSSLIWGLHTLPAMYQKLEWTATLGIGDFDGMHCYQSIVLKL